MNLFKPIVFSAIQPSGQLTLGNYIGSILHWEKIQESNHCIYSIADLHAITVPQEYKIFEKNKLDTLSFYLASGINPEKSIIFVQSEIYEHCQLNWILNCYTYFGELTRMTQFKKKSKQHSKNINVGLLNYPILMSSDILLYHSDYVVVGQDQTQHLELARNIAMRFNSIHGKIFKIPSIYHLNYCCKKIMSLLNPKKKMSKSDMNKNNVIFLLDDKESIFKKISRAVTDSESKIVYELEKKPGISNLLNIVSSLTGKDILQLEKDFIGLSYHDFKFLTAKIIFNTLERLQESFFLFRKNESYLKDILRDGAIKARYHAKKTLEIVYCKLGLSIQNNIIF